ncbi:MAG: hypothetical protein Q3986_09690 [Akkermansia sp.]|nr:hypothetical protein [Akkermansia sp.]
MKTHPLLPLLAFCLCTAPVDAAEGQGLSKQEMTNLYGEDFAKETAEAQKLIDEEWDADTIDEDAVEEETPAPAEPQPAAVKADDKAAAQEAAMAKAAEEEAAKEAAKAAAKAKALRKKLLESTVALVKSKRSVDAKIKSSRNSIDQQRAKIASIQEKLEKKRDKALAKNDPTGLGRMANRWAEEHPEWTNPGGNGGQGAPGGWGMSGGRGGRGGWGGGRGGRGGWGAAALPQASTQDRQTVKNAQKNIKELKKAIPQLVTLSYQMSERIESQLATLGKVQNTVLNSYDPDANPEKEGCEADQAPEDTYKPR